jgi:TrpR family trp operon transcriptional repressor
LPFPNFIIFLIQIICNPIFALKPVDGQCCNGVTLQNMMKGWNEFLDLCSKAQTSKDLENLLNLFLTLEEKELLASRYLIIKALMAENLTQREIAEVYHVSISQITRGSNALKIIDRKLKKFLEIEL